jgi:adenylate kinase family enzyme
LELKRRKKETVLRRLGSFHQVTEPILQFYRSEGLLHTITADNSKDSYAKALEIIKRLGFQPWRN